jgi:hypothetical protein
MADVPQRPPRRKDPDLSIARERLDAFLAAGDALAQAWHPKLDVSTCPTFLPSFRDLMKALRCWRDEVCEVAAIAEDDALEPLDLADAAQVRTWLTHLEEQIDDAVAAGEDATRPSGLRELGRCMARRKMLEARESLGSLIEMARRGMEAQ